jgi:hypothetical protein
MKTSFTFTKHIDNTIKVGDQVCFYDGSAISCDESITDDPMYIVFEYPELTGSSKILKEIIGIVSATGIKDRVCHVGNTGGYLQDCIVKLGNGYFRTCSQFVHKI